MNNEPDECVTPEPSVETSAKTVCGENDLAPAGTAVVDSRENGEQKEVSGHEQSREKVAECRSLEEELATILNEARTATLDPPGLMDTSWEFDQHIWIQSVVKTHEFGKRITDLVVRDPRFRGSASIMVSNGSGYTGFYPNFFGVRMLSRLHRTGDAADAVSWLRKVLDTSEAFVQSITALWGVRVDSAVQLTEYVRIVPLAALRDSANKRRMERLPVDSHRDTLFSFLQLEAPGAALVTRHRIAPYARRSEETADRSASLGEIREIRKRLPDVILALTVVGPTPRVPIQAAHWFEFEDPDLQDAHAEEISQAVLEILPARPGVQVPLDSNEAVGVLQQYMSIDGASKSKLRIALERLHQALRRHRPGDCAVDLCIALEALVGDDAKDEMAWKVRCRSARLLGGSDAVRTANADIVKRTYDIRSKVVHSGHVDLSKKHKVGEGLLTVEGVLDRAARLCADLVKAIIRRGSIPDWAPFDVVKD